MVEYIDREVLLKDIEESVVFTVRSDKPSLEIRGANKIIDRLKVAPTADVVEVRYGEWKGCECSVCGKVSPTVHLDVENEYKIRKTPYCPNCGAKMDGKDGAE